MLTRFFIILLFTRRPVYDRKLWDVLGVTPAGDTRWGWPGSRALTHLDLRNNRISSSAVTSLADALAQNSTLITLDLRWTLAVSASVSYTHLRAHETLR